MMSNVKYNIDKMYQTLKALFRNIIFILVRHVGVKLFKYKHDNTRIFEIIFTLNLIFKKVLTRRDLITPYSRVLTWRDLFTFHLRVLMWRDLFTLHSRVLTGHDLFSLYLRVLTGHDLFSSYLRVLTQHDLFTPTQES